MSILIISEKVSQLVKRSVAIQIGKQALVLSTEPVFILGGDLRNLSRTKTGGCYRISEQIRIELKKMDVG